MTEQTEQEQAKLSDIDKIIYDLFSNRWVGKRTIKSQENMRDQLYKTLSSLTKGYWSGHTAYHIAVDGGFIKDAKSGVPKQLTELGKAFVKSWESELQVYKGS